MSFSEKSHCFLRNVTDLILMNSDDLMGSSHDTIVTAIYYRSKWVQHDINRIFHKRTKLAIMPIFVSDALLCKNKKIQ